MTEVKLLFEFYDDDDYYYCYMFLNIKSLLS